MHDQVSKNVVIVIVILISSFVFPISVLPFFPLQFNFTFASQWDSRLFNYGSWEVLRFLLSNLR